MSHNENIPTKRVLPVLLNAIDKRMFFCYLALDIIAILLSVSVANAIGAIVDNINRGTITFELLIQLVIITLLTACVKSLRTKILSLAASGITNKLQKKTMNVLLFGDFNTKQNLRTGNIISKVNSSMSVIRPLIASNIPWIINLCLSTMATLIYISFFLPKVALISFFLIIGALIAQVNMSRRVQTSDHENQKLRISLVENARDIIRIFPIIKSFILANEMKKKINSINFTLFKGERKVIPIWTIMYALGFILAMLPMVMLLIIGALSVKNQIIAIGQLLTFCIMLRPITQSLMDFAFVIGDIRVAVSRIAEMDEIWCIQNEMSGNEICPYSNASDIIVVENLFFSYGSSFVLKNVYCTIARNKLTAFVGRSGSGKSTLIRIISSVLHAEKGCSFNGIEYNNLNLHTLRNNISYIPQEPILFTGTIYDNIACGLPEITSDDVIEAIEMVGLGEFVASLSEREYTIIDGIDSRFSGGQKQRIALARALVKKCNLLILDEPTASVDAMTESDIMGTLNRILLSGNKTILLSAHKLELVTNADMIYVFSDGEIVERGTHKELTKDNGCYMRLWESQQGV